MEKRIMSGNETVALDAGIGGTRAFCAFKHAGADPVFSLAAFDAGRALFIPNKGETV